MSGPVSTADAAAEPAADRPEECDLEVLVGRNAEVGSFGVNRVLRTADGHLAAAG